MTDIDPIELTRQLVRMDTRNPPGNEEACARFLAELLQEAGFAVESQAFGEGRVNLVARHGARPGGLVFTGHLDTVPLGAAPWSRDPFGGEIADGRLYGRGTTDMKAGVAAMVAAACRLAASADGSIVLALTGGEETGSEGAKALVASGLIGEAALLVVGEPTANRLLAGHKGALWLNARWTGVTAHGSTPHLGDNAIYKAAHGALAVEKLHATSSHDHPVMGRSSFNASMISGGQNINSVPDHAQMAIDVRTVPGHAHAAVRDELTAALGHGVELDTLVDLPAVWTEADRPALQAAALAYRRVTGREAALATANYFTDASVFTPALAGVPTLICGPGDPAMAHKTDEYCEVALIDEAVAIYAAIASSILSL